MLTQEQLQTFHSQGYLAIPHFFDSFETLKSQASRLLERQEKSTTRFNTSLKDHVSGEYFLTSGDKIRYFLEEHSDQINKIGHGLHMRDEIFSSFTINDSIRSIAQSLQFTDPRVLQSMLIFKQPRVGGAVPCHQDSTFLYTNPLSAVGFWFALDDCTAENGCMEFVPGSHLTYPISKRFVRDPDQRGTHFEILKEDLPAPLESDWVCTPTPPGTLVLIHGSVLHRSKANTSEKSRWIYTFHVIEGTAEYPKDNWLQTDQEFTQLF